MLIPFSVGVISAFNPYGEKADAKANRQAQTMLKSDVDRMRLKYVERNGMYMGHKEKYLLVQNISCRELIRLAHVNTFKTLFSMENVKEMIICFLG